MWRPDGWNNPFPVEKPIPEEFTYGSAYHHHLLFEAGADATLGALKGNGIFTYGNHTPDIDLDDVPEESGYWCFIPKEVEED
ncbi:unnamed protein product [marine sediment metagenome]|uniref:Uncharacterized protein n=1 Tax=marine sediment metagenome TaxID=412755 RepID=X0U1A0_9ZZZZ